MTVLNLFVGKAHAEQVPEHEPGWRFAMGGYLEGLELSDKELGVPSLGATVAIRRDIERAWGHLEMRVFAWGGPVFAMETHGDADLEVAYTVDSDLRVGIRGGLVARRISFYGYASDGAFSDVFVAVAPSVVAFVTADEEAGYRATVFIGHANGLRGGARFEFGAATVVIEMASTAGTREGKHATLNTMLLHVMRAWSR